MQIAIVHNNVNIVRLFIYLINELGFSIVWSCATAKEALELSQQNHPDLLLVQLDLDDMECRDFIKKIMDTCATTVIATSDPLKNQPGKIFEAMSAGALDTFAEPSTDHSVSLDELKNKILNIKKLHDSLTPHVPASFNSTATTATLVAIGASTGGPAALLTILKKLPKKNNAIWVIIQHMDNQFSEGMANWLDSQIDMPLTIAKSFHTPQADQVYMAGTNDHLIINKSGQFEYTKHPEDYPYRPSVDVFFNSVITHWPNKLIGVLLTGMGRDGANGLLSFYKQGMLTIAQDEHSSAVYGMPKAAKDLNAVTVEMDVNDIADKLLKNLN